MAEKGGMERSGVILLKLSSEKMSCPVMKSSGGGSCPVMHNPEKGSFDAEYCCANELRVFNHCQSSLVPQGEKSHCDQEAQMLRTCELARRRREKAAKKYSECIKQGGDALSCLTQSKS